jgi:hypothetical protein
MLHQSGYSKKETRELSICSPFMHGVQCQVDGISIDEEITDVLEIDSHSVYFFFMFICPFFAHVHPKVEHHAACT